MSIGQIHVETENIFPIIKKFLYSDHEIFLRELVSNGVDACNKLKALSSMGEFNGEIGDLLVEVELNTENKTLTIKDNGIGMTQDEVVKYIAQIAFSGAEEFVQKYKDKADGIIGHFGLGFFSSFMVADKVEVISKSYKDEPAAHWTCDGSPEYSISEHDKTERGTEIILHINEDSAEFLEDSRVSSLLSKYCKFLPVEIKYGTKTETIKKEATEEGAEPEEESFIVDNIINNPRPAWTKSPSDLSDEDYKGFYNELYPMSFDEPLFNIHLNVDYPFNLTGILYFPKLKNNIEVQKNKIQLYCNQVFVTDSVEGIVPEFLTLLHGVIDSPDIPLNVSRSYLQSDGNVKKISNHITKKVADKLEEIFKNNREDFEAKWKDIQVFIEYGALSEDKFYDRAEKFLLVTNQEDKHFTLEEYKEHIQGQQKNKDDKCVVLYTNDPEGHHSYIASAKERGYDVITLDSPLSSHLVNKLEQKHTDLTFARIDADTLDKLIDKDEEIPSKLNKEQEESLKPVFESQVVKEKFTVVFESLSEKENPIMITQPEFMRRMRDMQQVGGGAAGFMGNMPEMYNLVVNSNHPLTNKILEEQDESKQQGLAKQAVDLALLSQGMLKGEDLTQFIKRSIELID